MQPSENSILLALGVLVGLATGVSVWLFRLGIDLFHKIFAEFAVDTLLGPVLGPASIIVTLAAAGFIVGWIMNRYIGEERHHGVARIIEAVTLGGGRLCYSRIPFKAVASALSLGAGASVGPEDPSVQIGSNIGSMIGQRLFLSQERIRLLVAAGAAGAIAAAFNAPIAGVFFALEVILGEFTTDAFGLVVLAAVIASIFVQAGDELMPLHEAGLNLLNYRLGNLLEMPLYALLGIVFAPLAVFFVRFVYWQHDQWHKHVHLPRPVQTALAGAIVGAVGIFLPQILGPGRDAMNAVLTNPDHFTIMLLAIIGVAKILMTGLSMAGGFVGGIFAPSLFVGLMFGSVFGRVIELLPLHGFTSDPQAYSIVGMAAMMAGMVRAPITAILLVFELTNDYRLIPPIMLASVVCIHLAEYMIPEGIYALGLSRKGVHLQQVRDKMRLNAVTGAHIFEMQVVPNSPIDGRYISDIRWPVESVVASIRRENRLLIPHGSTQIKKGDRITLVAAPEAESELALLVGLKRP